MPVNGPRKRFFGLFFWDRTIACFDPGSGWKRPLCDPLKSSDCQNTAKLGLIFAWRETGPDKGSDWIREKAIRAQIGAGLV